MAYQVTARKWRPSRFDQVVAQEHITTTLQNAVISARVAQAYLFCGPRGVGKTTTARILAKALNCPNRQDANPCDACSSCRSITAGTSMNVLEIDGASNNSVDDIRELRETVRYLPTEGSHRIYIIDEVHMLSTAAFNALLKTLEEPPAHVVFVFATTEVQEVPETILSRCQRFNFRRIPALEIAAQLRTIARAEDISADEEALFLLAARADGALRDAQSLLDQVVSFSPEGVSLETVHQVLGLVDSGIHFELTAALADGAADRVLEIVARVIDSGADVEEFVHGFTEHVRNLMYTCVHGSARTLEVAETMQQRYEQATALFGEDDLVRMLHDLLDLQTVLRRSVQPRFRVEMALVRLAHMGRTVAVGELLQRIAQLEAGLRGGGASAAMVPAPPDSGISGGSGVPPAGTKPAATGSGVSGHGPASAPHDGESVAAAPHAGADSSSVSATPMDTSGHEADTGTTLTLARVQQDWGELIDEVRGAQPALAMFLGHARLLALDGQVLTLSFADGDRFQLTQVQRYRETVESLAQKHFGQRLRLDFRSMATDAPDRSPPPAVETDPAVRSVLDTFDGELI